jgi:UDP-N-acetylglucosamine--N-acetylmuramyl-(pentapeptide) pyrophosphoryl-undecaprenol N-acetylglucosamine transferase
MNEILGRIGRGVVVLAAGGTGGHLFPAQALAEELVKRGYIIHLVTDERVADYGKTFPAIETHIIPSATLSLSKPWLLPMRLLRLYKGFRLARSIFKSLKPNAVVGFGGYPSFPPLIAASRLGIPCCVHDQNAMMGRANRVLSRFVDVVASSFPDIAGLPAKARKKVVVTGNPVRSVVITEQNSPYPEISDDLPFNLLVFGGSQGARFFSEFMPGVVEELPKDVLRTLHITQQCRKEDLAALEAKYVALDLSFDLAPFFLDMPQKIADSHLVFCRSGASTIAELGVIGRPAVMVPLPHAIDNDQLRNAESFANAGAGWIKPQAELEASEFAAFLTRLRFHEEELQDAAHAALAHGKPDAAQRLADVTEKLVAKSAKKRTREKRLT